MKFKKNISKEELKNSLLQSLEYNSKALDYIENVLNRAEDNLKYNPDDPDFAEIVSTVKYIKFSLSYLDNQYNESLKRLGVKFGSYK